MVLVMETKVARKKVEDMSKEELLGLILWMEKRIKYMRFLVMDMEA